MVSIGQESVRDCILPWKLILRHRKNMHQQCWKTNVTFSLQICAEQSSHRKYISLISSPDVLLMEESEWQREFVDWFRRKVFLKLHSILNCTQMVLSAYHAYKKWYSEPVDINLHVDSSVLFPYSSKMGIFPTKDLIKAPDKYRIALWVFMWIWSSLNEECGLNGKWRAKCSSKYF